jgi:hypothetical protein
MAKFTKGSLSGENLNGFDVGRTLQVIQVGKKTTIYLAEAPDAEVGIQADPGSSTSVVEIEEVDAAKLSAQEKKAKHRKFRLKGLATGTARITAGGLITPLSVVVVANPESRIFDGGKDTVPASIVRQLKAYGLRGAAIRIAEDQMVSDIGRTSGKGEQRYVKGNNEDGSSYDWCGAFAQWCYQVAARLIGETNPFGDTAWALASPQRAISWAMAHPSLATVVRYEGANTFKADGKIYGDPKTRAEKQEMVEIQVAAHGNPSNVIEGDICLHRNSGGGWQHVSIVYGVSGSESFDTINGNPKIWVDRGLKFSDKVGKVPRYTFLHLSLPPVDWVSGWMSESSASGQASTIF